jgi:hypothetical protein
MRKRMKNDKSSKSRRSMKRAEQPSKPIEREYRQIFTPHPLPSNGLYTDEDSLEQPSALEDVPTTSTPSVAV